MYQACHLHNAVFRCCLVAIAILCLCGGSLRSLRAQVPSAHNGATPEPSHSQAPTLLEGRAGAVLPFVYDPPARSFIVVQARLNDSLPMNFEVDTGSSYTLLLTPRVQRTLNLKLTENTTVQPGNHVGQFTAPVEFSAVTDVGSLPLDCRLIGVVADVPVMTDHMAARVDGVLGGEFFRKLPCRFDFDKRTLTFYAADGAPILSPPASATFPMVPGPDDALPTVRLPLTRDVSATVMVDTGMSESRLPSDTARKLKFLASGGRGIVVTADDTRQTQRYLLEALTLGPLTTPLVPITSQDGLTVGSLGIDLLSRFCVTLDPRHKQLVLEPRASLTLQLTGATGLEVAQRADKFYLSQVDPNVLAPALAVGDQVLSVDGDELSSLPYYQVLGQVMYSVAGAWMHLLVEKPDHTRVSATILRRSSYSGVAVSGVGVVLHQEKAGGLRVLYVEPGSMAEKAGIKATDELISVNGHSVRSLSADQVTQLLAGAGLPSAPPNTLVFQSRSDNKEVTLTEQVPVLSADRGASTQPADNQGSR